MTVKDELHALVERLAEQDAREVLDYLRTRIEPASRPSRAFIEESQRAVDESTAPDAVRVPHEAVRAWLQSWETSEEGAADVALQALEERLRRDSQGATGK
ncbi:MAG: hypothetical protein M3O34_08555 [Chloroflexota bacterium]|nr:hypothetical protein [Chloroflexota bacterium]